MRPSTTACQKVFATCEATVCRSIRTTPRTPSTSGPQACLFCRARLSKSVVNFKAQRRWISSAAIATSTSTNDPIRSTPIPRTHYDLFPQTLPSGPPPNGPFPIDIRALRKEFLQLQAKAHPDRHPASLKTRAEATSAHINEAYKTLQNPLTRAQYLLSLRGINIAEDETAKVEDPELLMEVLELRERIEDAEEEGEIEDMRTVNEERIRESEERLDRFFKKDEIEGAKEEAVRLRYWVNVRESLDAWEKGKPVVLVH